MEVSTQRAEYKLWPGYQIPSSQESLSLTVKFRDDQRLLDQPHLARTLSRRFPVAFPGFPPMSLSDRFRGSKFDV